MSTVKVNAIRSTSGTSDAITLNSSSGVTAINGASLKAHNLIINGAFTVAQRGTSATAEEYATVDRFELSHGGEDEDCTQAQHAMTSSDTGHWANGFRYSYHITNGNQTSGGDAGDFCFIRYRAEAQDIASSGWDYTSASSYVTLSFWVKASVAQNYYGYIRTDDGTSQGYPFQTGSLSANTWTKITKTIPGNSNITVNNDNGIGLEIHFVQYLGTNYTGSGVTLDAWATYNTSARMADNTDDWWDTDNATFEITGVQLEVGSTASEYMHESYGETLAKCQRYYYKHLSGNNLVVSLGFSSATDQVSGYIQFPTTMRATPSIDHTSGDNYYRLGAGNLGGDKYVDGAWALQGATDQSTRIYATPQSTLTAGEPGLVDTTSASASMAFSAEL